MKFLPKSLALFVFFVLGFSALTSCTGTKTQPNDGDTAQANVNTDSAPSEKSKSAYPPMPAAIMQEPFKLVDGTTLTLNDKKGKVILINLWATWCGPCRSEMPHLVEMQNQYRDKGFEIIGLDIDPESVEEINDFAKEMKLNYTLGWTGELRNDFARLGKFEGIPQSFLIDRGGHLRGVFLGGSKKVVDKMKETVETLIDE